MKSNKVLTKVAILFICFLTVGYTATAQLSEGDILFVGFNADNSNGFSIAAMNDIPANSRIFFTDNEWNGLPIGAGGAFNNNNEGELTWDTGGAPILAGTVVHFTGTSSVFNGDYGSTIGSISGTLNPNAGKEVIYAFIGTNDTTPTTFLAAISNRNFSNANGTLTNTGLTSGVNAMAIAGNEDVMVYSGPTICTPDITNCSLGIVNPANWSTEDGTGNQSQNGNYPDFPDDAPIIFVASSVLPISLTSFEVKSYHDNKALIEWVTETEINNSRFEVQRSIDAENWEVISVIEGAGNSTDVLYYEIIDSNPLSGVSYYRLKQTDFDGGYEYFPPQSFNYNPKIDLTLYPNPATHEITLAGSDIEQAEMILFNGMGKNVPIMEMYRGKDKINFNISDLTPGMYFLRILNRGVAETIKFKKD